MKKVIVLVQKDHSAQSIAETIVKSFGTAKNVLFRIGAANPAGERKIAIGPINGEENREFIEDILDTTEGVIAYKSLYCTSNMGLRGTLETELETSAMPDLMPYVPEEPKVEGEPEPEAAKPEPIQTAPPQVTEPPVTQKVVVAQGFLEFCKSLENLGVDRESAIAYGMRMIEVIGGKVETRVTFQDGSVLRRVGDKWEVA